MSLTALGFLLCFSLGLILALAVRPVYGLYTYVAVFYLHPPSRWWGSMLPDVRWSLFAAAITLLAVFIHRERLENPLRQRWYSHTIAKVMILYAAWMWLQLPWVVSPWHMDGAILFTKYALLFYLMYVIIDNERDLLGFGLAHVFGCAYLGWLVYLAPSGGRLEGVGGPGIDNANSLGMHLGTGLVFAAFLLMATRGWLRWLVLATLPFILNGIIQTETRGAIVGLLVAGAATVYLKPKRFRRTYYVLGVLGLSAVFVLGNEAFMSRMSTLSAAVDERAEWDNSAGSRIEVAKAQWRMFKDHPLGAGHQGTAALSRAYLEERLMARNSGDRASHNTILSVVVDQGLPGIVLISVLGFSVLRGLRRCKRLDEHGLPDSLALARTMIGGALVTIVGAGMFAQYLKAEVLFWNLALLAILMDMADRATGLPDGSSKAPQKRSYAHSQVRSPPVSG